MLCGIGGGEFVEVGGVNSSDTIADLLHSLALVEVLWVFKELWGGL